MRFPAKIVLFTIAMLAGTAKAHAADRWISHPTFDGAMSHLFETPGFVYFTSSVLPENNFFDNAMSLFRYDKSSGEVTALSSDNLLTSATVADVEYCPPKGYVAAVCSNHDVCLVYDNGSTAIIPGYRLADIDYPKTVNGITPDPLHDRIYIATCFGFVAIDDEKRLVAESRIYGEPLQDIARCGGVLLAVRAGELIFTDADSPARNIAEFSKIEGLSDALSLHFLGEDKCILLCGNELPRAIKMVDCTKETPQLAHLTAGRFFNIDATRNGLIVSDVDRVILISSDGTLSDLPRDRSLTGASAGTMHLPDVWFGYPRKGIHSERYDNSMRQWSANCGDIPPDSPSPYISTEMNQDQKHGLMVMNFGFNYNLAKLNAEQPFLLSAYRDGSWRNLSPAYTYPEQTNALKRPTGFAIDPDNHDYVYVSSVSNGFARINLADGSDIIHFSRPSDPGKDLTGFVSFVPDQIGDNSWCCRFSAPRFDSYGNLWMSYADFDNQSPERLHLYCWEKADRLASTSSADVKLPQHVEVEGLRPTNTDMVLPLRHQANRNLIVYANGVYDFAFAVIDTSGTPTDTSDDRKGIVNTLHDRDGNAVNAYNVRCLWEDPSTGNVWVGHSGGVFYFNPRDFLEGETTVTKIKVARNDGTNLADFLLDEVTVNNICADRSGRKWFATGGAGLVSLNADGRTIGHELTTDNSRIPDNIVHAVGFVEDTNSIMVSTDKGIAEFFPTSLPGSPHLPKARAYPNPVRPDYNGFVTIDGIPEESLVKIVGSSGQLVKELLSGGSTEVKWDVTDLSRRRVGSGVYYVLVSDTSEDSGFSEVAKILVVN